jgi:CO/xanthine dehydrogenase FAD-binding subunit
VRTVADVPAPPDVLIPTSPEEARSWFGEAPDTLIVGGGTIVMPDLGSGTRRPSRVMLLTRASLSGCRYDGDRLRIGATTTLEGLVGAPEPLGSAARSVADAEIRGQATIAGNICAGPGRDAPRGDLQAPLIAMDARVSWTDGGAPMVEPVERFLATPALGKLVVEIEVAVPTHGAYAGLRRPHSHGYTPVAVCYAQLANERRWAASGLGPHALRLLSDTHPVPAVEGWQAPDDAVASAWYRNEIVAVLVGRCLAEAKR